MIRKSAVAGFFILQKIFKKIEKTIALYPNWDIIDNVIKERK